MLKKKIYLGVFLSLTPIFLIAGFFFFIILLISSDTTNDNCDTPSVTDVSKSTDSTSVPKSIDEFVKQHKDAYILSWKAGGFLPSASIAQTMVENGFNFSNPSGTSLWQAHNMGGGTTRFSISVEIAK